MTLCIDEKLTIVCDLPFRGFSEVPKFSADIATDAQSLKRWFLPI